MQFLQKYDNILFSIGISNPLRTLAPPQSVKSNEKGYANHQGLDEMFGRGGDFFPPMILCIRSKQSWFGKELPFAVPKFYKAVSSLLYS